MPKTLMHSLKMGRDRSSTPTTGKYLIVPILACAYTIIVSPLLMLATTGPPSGTLQSLMAPHPENRYAWSTLAAISLSLAVRHASRLRRLTFPPHILCLLAYLAFAGTSILSAFKPEVSSIRFVSQAMIITSIVLPAMLAARTTDMMRWLFLCFAFASILNVFFVLEQPPNIYNKMIIGYPGYYPFKGILGECA